MPYIKLNLSDELGPALELDHDDSPVLRDLGNGLLVAYLVDAGQSFEYVQNRHLSMASISVDELHTAALNNLLVFAGKRTRMQPHGNIFAMFLDGNFEASLLLVDQLWDQSLVEYAQNGFVVAIPARDILAFADIGSAAGIAELHDVVSRAFQIGDHSISQDLYKRQSGCWVRFAG